MASGRSADSKTTKAASPPSSSASRLMPTPHCSYSNWPTAVLPVNDTAATDGLRHSVEPAPKNSVQLGTRRRRFNAEPYRLAAHFLDCTARR